MNTKKRRLPRLLIISVILLALLTVSALAYLSASTGDLVNTFEPAKETDPGINETFNGTEKTNVAVNVGDPGYAVYVRAAIVVNWEQNGIDSDGNKTITRANTGIYHATAPVAGTDYEITLNTTDWFEEGGFYYYKAMVSSGATNPLITSCKLKDGAVVPDGYHLDVQIIAQTIQALGTTDAVDANGEPIDGIPAVTDAWGITVDSSGNLVAPTP